MICVQTNELWIIRNVTDKLLLQIIYKQDLTLNNPLGLIYLKTSPIK